MESRQIVINNLILWPFEIEGAELIYEIDSNPEILKFIGIPTKDTLQTA